MDLCLLHSHILPPCGQIPVVTTDPEGRATFDRPPVSSHINLAYICGPEQEHKISSTETYILSYVKRIASPGLMHETGCSGMCTAITLRDGIGREVVGGVQDGEHMYAHG